MARKGLHEPQSVSRDSVLMPFTKKVRSLVSVSLVRLKQPLLCRNAPAVYPGQNKGTPRALQRVRMSERSRQSISHLEFSPDCMVLIVARRVGSHIKRGQTHQATANSPLLFPQEFRLIERDRVGTSGCLCLNHMERLPSRSPGSPGILPHWV